MPTTRHKLEVRAEPGKQELFITRQFDAPRAAVFAAFTDAEAIAKWWGPRQYTTIVDKFEPRPAGSWRFLNREADGTEYGFHGVIHELTPNERIVQTFEYEGWAGHCALDSLTFEDFEGGTILRGQSVFQSVEDRDGMIESGMETGASESYERLEEYLEASR